MNRFLIILALQILIGPMAIAQDIGVRAQSFAGAFRAVASSNDIIFSNPAGILKFRRLSVEGDYQLGLYDKSNRLTVSMLDSQTTTWGMGIAYSPLFRSDSTSHAVYLALAMPLGTDMLALGASATYVYDPREINFRHFFNSDLGLMINMPFGLSLSFVLDHLVKPKGNEKPLGFAVASALNIGKFASVVPLTLSFDWLMNDVTSNHDLKHEMAGGGEFLLFSLIPFRAGYKYKAKQQFVSLGSGFLMPLIALDVVFEQNLITLPERHLGIGLRFNL
jgi:hypothetical protein